MPMSSLQLEQNFLDNNSMKDINVVLKQNNIGAVVKLNHSEN